MKRIKATKSHKDERTRLCRNDPVVSGACTNEDLGGNGTVTATFPPVSVCSSLVQLGLLLRLHE